MKSGLVGAFAAGVLGVLVGTAVRPGPAQASRLTLTGDAPPGSTEGRLAVTATFRDPVTGKPVAVREGEAEVRGGRFVFDAEPVGPDGVYALTVAPAGAPQTTTFVQLQTATPGAQQVGNINVSGTVLAGRVGIGIEPTNARLQIEDATDTQGLRVRTGGTALLAQSLATTGTGFGGQFTSASAGGRAIFGETTATSGPTIGGFFRSRSSEGIGMRADVTSLTGSTAAIVAQASSPDGIGVAVNSQGSGVSVFGQVVGVSASSPGFGGDFVSTGPLSDGVRGRSSAPSGAGAGGRFTNNASGGIGVLGIAGATSGSNVAGEFQSASTSGRGAFGNATATSGTTIGVLGQVASTSGRAVVGTATATSGSTRGGDFSSSSSSGTAVRGLATSTTGSNFGGVFESSSPTGTALFARAASSASAGIGVRAISNGPSSVGVFASAGQSTGTAKAVQATVFSAQGVAVRADNVSLGESVELAGSTSALHVDGTPTVQSGAAVVPMMPILMGRMGQTGSNQPLKRSDFGGYTAAFFNNGGDERIVITPTVAQLSGDEVVMVNCFGAGERAFVTYNASSLDPLDKITIRVRTFDGGTFATVDVCFVVYDFVVPGTRPGARRP